MKIKIISVLAGMLLPMALPAFAQSSEQHRPYKMSNCLGFMSSAFDLSDEHKVLDDRSTSPSTIPGIARVRISDDVREHYIAQCDLMKANEPYDDQCPLGQSLVWDEYVQAAFEEFGGIELFELRRIEREQIAIASESRDTMREACAK